MKASIAFLVLDAEDGLNWVVSINIDRLTYHSSSSNPAVGPPSQIAWQQTMIRWLIECCAWKKGECLLALDIGKCSNSSNS